MINRFLYIFYLPIDPTLSHQVSIEQEINLARPKPCTHASVLYIPEPLDISTWRLYIQCYVVNGRMY